jgi:ankyrin repeat protein
MDFKPLPLDSVLEAYQQQAAALFEGYQAGAAEVIQLIHRRHPRFLDERIPWLPKNVSDAEIRGAGLDLADAQLALARWYDFRDWAALAAWTAAVTTKESPVFRFEAAVEAVIDGDLPALQSLLREDPELVHARSTRVTHFDPPVHRSTLLHYVAANGVEGYRQRTPRNAVEIAKALLQAGAEVDSLADLYGGRCTTMSLLVSSSHPAEAGVQVALVDTLVDFGASLEEQGDGNWRSPLMTALIFGYRDTAEALVRRGAGVDHIAAAAGLGRLEETSRLLPAADASSRHRALSLAAQLGHADAVRLLLDAGEDPNRYNPDGYHSHATPLHQAVSAGHDAVVHLLVERGVRLDMKDTIYQGTPLGWAIYCGKKEIEKYLRARGAKTSGELES